MPISSRPSAGEAVQAQLEDRADLDVGELVAVAFGCQLDRFDQPDIGRDLGDRPLARRQRGARLGGVGRAADDPHDFVEVGDRDDEAEQDVRSLAGLEQLVFRAAGDHLLAEGDEGRDDVLEPEDLRPPAADREHVGGEARLRGRVPPELVEHHVGRRVALELHDDAHALARAFVADVGDALDPLFLGGFGDLLDQPVLADLIGNFGEDDRALVALPLLDDIARADDDRAAAGMIGVARAALAEDHAAAGEIGGGYVGHQLVDGDRAVLDIGFAGGDDLAEIVRRNVGRHADRDAAGAVDEQVGEARGQHDGLALRAVIVGLEVDRVLVDVLEQRVGRAREPRLGVAHRRGRIGVHRSEIALAVDQRQPHRPVLRHPRERVVDRAVAVRMIFTHHVADETRRLAIGLAGDEAAFLRAVEDAAMDGLQAVAHVGQRAADDHRHGVVEIARLHLVDDRDGGDIGGVDGRRGAGQI